MNDKTKTINATQAMTDRAMTGLFSRAFAQPLKLLSQPEASLSSYAVFWCVAFNEGATQVEVARLTGLSAKTVSRVISQLGDATGGRGWIRQATDAADRRVLAQRVPHPVVRQRDGEAVHIARASVYSESEQAEHFNLRRNAALLQRIAEATGGSYFDAGNLDGIADLLRYSSAGITEQILRPVWNAPAVFLVLLVLKLGEWLLRRRWRTI